MMELSDYYQLRDIPEQLAWFESKFYGKLFDVY